MMARVQTPLCAVETAPTLPELRDYQRSVVLDVARNWSAGRTRVLVVAATGSGKTHTAAALVKELERRGRHVLFVVHRDVLIQQTTDSLAQWGIRCGHIKAGYQEDRGALVQVASVQTLERRDWWSTQRFDFAGARPAMVLDECHVTAWATVIQRLLARHSEMLVVGLTATPWRLSPREDMGDVFTGVALAPFPADLIRDGYLVPPVYYGTAAPPDMRGVRMQAGEYLEGDLLTACDRPELIAAIYGEWVKLAHGQRTLVFCTGVAHARHMAAYFTAQGVAAASVDGETPIPERTALYAALRAGRLTVLASCAVLQEGFDVPEVSCVILSRPTKSHALYTQQLGRGLRIAPWDDKQKCIVLDQSGNVGRFGFIEDFDTFTLERGKPDAPKRSSDEESLTKECPECRRICPRATRACPGCGFAWPFAEDRRPPAPIVPLRELSHGGLSVDERREVYRELLRMAFWRVWKPEAAAARYKQRFGQWPARDWTRGAVLGDSPSDEQVAGYRRYLEQVAKVKAVDDAETWAMRWMVNELGTSARTEAQS